MRQQRSSLPRRPYVQGDHGEGGANDGQKRADAESAADQERMLQLLEQALLRRTPLKLLQEESAKVDDGGHEESKEVVGGNNDALGTVSAALATLRDARRGLAKTTANPILYPLPSSTGSHSTRGEQKGRGPQVADDGLTLGSGPAPVRTTHQTTRSSTAVALEYAKKLPGHKGSHANAEEKRKAALDLPIDRADPNHEDEDMCEEDAQDLAETSNIISVIGVEKVDLRRKSVDGQSQILRSTKESTVASVWDTEKREILQFLTEYRHQ